MTVVTAGPAKWTWSEDVLKFAREAGVEQHLDALMEMTRELFPGALEIRVSVVRDPEIAAFDAIVWEADVPKEQVDDYSGQMILWGREFYRVCPPDPLRVYPFAQQLFRV